VELVFDELKTHLVQRRRVFRSKTPELVREEFYGWIMAHYAVRWLMYQGATQASIPERTLSFVANVQLLRRALPQAPGHEICAVQSQHRQLILRQALSKRIPIRHRVVERMMFWQISLFVGKRSANGVVVLNGGQRSALSSARSLPSQARPMSERGSS
jgi:hypothetical protein